jgi:hypothetical protein
MVFDLLVPLNENKDAFCIGSDQAFAQELQKSNFSLVDRTE